ncbi:MAG: GH3 auxin-responsive promoter family protein [Pseudanabaenales cyanobacterium]|nr:GH3 auxin-responsive promoter family protein [Pseudanabaenales cyanobacterium]
MANGETNILTPDRLIYFNMTSGSTGKQKLIPVTQRSRQAISRANQAGIGFVIDAARDQAAPLCKILQLSGYLEQYADPLIHDLEKGEIASWLPLEPALLV